MAVMIKNISGYEGKLVFDTSMPDGTFRKLLDVSKLHSLGWKPNIPFEEGVTKTYEEKFTRNQEGNQEGFESCL
jgi:GDP-L-fucose synthase